MFRKTVEEAITKSGEYGPYAVAGAALIATAGFFAYRSYQAYYKYELKPDGSKTITPIHGAEASANRAEAKDFVRPVALGKGPVKASADDAKAFGGGVEPQAIDSDTSLDKINAVLNPPPSAHRPR